LTGPTARAIMARRSRDSVPGLKSVREAIPAALEAVIERALEKVPADRYQTAEQFSNALMTASTGAISRVTGGRRSTLSVRPQWRRPIPVAGGLLLLAALTWLV